MSFISCEGSPVSPGSMCYAVEEITGKDPATSTSFTVVRDSGTISWHDIRLHGTPAAGAHALVQATSSLLASTKRVVATRRVEI